MFTAKWLVYKGLGSNLSTLTSNIQGREILELLVWSMRGLSTSFLPSVLLFGPLTVVLRTSGGLDQLGSGVLSAADGSHLTYTSLSLADEWQYWLGGAHDQSDATHSIRIVMLGGPSVTDLEMTLT